MISDRIVASLLEELRTGRYARADRLPAEVDLAAELGVSRTVIRDALDRKSTRLNSSHSDRSRMPSSA